MIPNPDFVNRPNNFWAIVKYASELFGYSNRLPKKKGMKIYKREEFKILEEKVNINNNLVSDVLIYLNYRNSIIEKNIAPLLMNRDQAKELFEHLRLIHNPKCTLPLNKQRADKRHFNYLSCIVNILVEVYLKGKTFCDNPRGLSLITDKDNKPVITLSR